MHPSSAASACAFPTNAGANPVANGARHLPPLRYAASGWFATLGLAVSLLLPSAAHAYTINTTEAGRPIRWGIDTVAFRVDPELIDALPGDQTRAAVDIAFDAWRGFPSVPDLRVADGEPSPLGYIDGAPTNGLYFIREWPHEHDKLAVTVVTYELRSGRVLDADILVNAQVPFALMAEPSDETQAYDLAAVLTHEAGHTLGLGESEDDVMATMWPFARQGDTHQRTLADDDEQGILQAYSGPPPLPLGGCGGMRIVGSPRGSVTGWLALGACLLLVLARGRRRVVAASTLTLVAVLGVGGPTQAFDDPSDRVAEVNALAAGDLAEARPLLYDALHDPSAEVRLSALELLERAGNAEHRALAEALAADPNATVGGRARELATRLAARAPSRSIPASAPDARARLDGFLGDSDARVHVGTARQVATDRVDGLFWTHYRVTAADGEVEELRVPGGVLGELGQRVGERPRPVDGAELMLVKRGSRPAAWAYHARNKLFGGWVGDGPAIRVDEDAR